MNRSTLFIVIFLLLLCVTAAPLLARDPLQGGQITDYQTDVFKPAIASQDVNLQSTVYEIYLSLVSSMNSSILCFDTEKNCIPKLLLQQQADAGIAPKTAGLIPDLFRLNAGMVQQKPLSSTEYLADVGTRLNIGAQPAYAQGIGYTGLAPVLKIWKAFRNIAYLFATIGFLVLAFMIMLRIKMGQSAINAQSAITKFVFVVILVTFSYAIAGFVVDLIYVFSNLIIALFINQGLITVPLDQAQAQLLSGNVLQTLGSLISLSDTAGQTVQNISQQFGNALTGLPIDNFLVRIFGGSIGMVTKLILGIAIIYSLFKLLVQLLFAYIQIILLTATAPLQILPDILPGGNAFMGWLRSIFAHAMIFPATVFMFIVGLSIVGGNSFAGIEAQLTPANYGLQLPFLNFSGDNLLAIIGLAFILVTPKVNDMVKDFFKVSSFKYTSAIGQAIGVGQAGAGAIGRAAAAPVTVPYRMARSLSSDVLKTGREHLARETMGRILPVAEPSGSEETKKAQSRGQSFVSGVVNKFPKSRKYE